MTHLIYVGIDGSGPSLNPLQPDPGYARNFADSHVNYFNKTWVPGDTFYKRGPTSSGIETGRLAKTAYEETLARVDRHGADTPIFLAGYSRGGAAVIDAAHRLKQDNIGVEALILFDAVDRTTTTGGWLSNTPIVDTVRTVIYAQRDPRARSRESFANCGMRRESPGTELYFKRFLGTHGGLGGCPWPADGRPKTELIDEGFPDFLTHVTYEADAIASRQVRTWVQNHLSNVVSRAIEERRQNEGPSSGTPSNPPPGTGERIHIVKSGDWLSKIAIQYYGDMSRWETIYDHPQNRKTIGPNPDLIKPGQRLIIP